MRLKDEASNDEINNEHSQNIQHSLLHRTDDQSHDTLMHRITLTSAIGRIILLSSAAPVFLAAEDFVEALLCGVANLDVLTYDVNSSSSSLSSPNIDVLTDAPDVHAHIYTSVWLWSANGS